jgi:kynurenine formamidase
MEAESPSGNWGRWGPDDERGALNLVTPEVVLEAARGIRTGKVYSLALPISRSRTPAVWDRPPPERFTRTAPHDQAERVGTDGHRVGSADDMLVLPSHAGTHIDALCHVFEGDSFYNGHPVDSFTTRRGAGKCSIVRTGTVATRAVLLDVPSALGLESLPGGYIITAEELDACCESEHVDVRPGDAVLIRTGWLEVLAGDASTPSFPQAGIGLDAARWLQAHDVCLVAADNSAVEVLPFDGGELAVHAQLIVHSGIALLEHAWLADLAADRCYVSLFVVGALPVVGATGSPVNPVAIG